MSCFLVAARFVLALMGALLLRLYWHGLVLPQGGSIRCNFSPVAFAWKIITVNTIVTILSFGLLHPWAQIRKLRYLTSHTVIMLPAGALDAMQKKATEREAAIGEEFEAAEGIGIDISIT